MKGSKINARDEMNKCDRIYLQPFYVLYSQPFGMLTKTERETPIHLDTLDDIDLILNYLEEYEKTNTVRGYFYDLNVESIDQLSKGLESPFIKPEGYEYTVPNIIKRIEELSNINIIKTKKGSCFVVAVMYKK